MPLAGPHRALLAASAFLPADAPLLPVSVSLQPLQRLPAQLRQRFAPRLAASRRAPLLRVSAKSAARRRPSARRRAPQQSLASYFPYFSAALPLDLKSLPLCLRGQPRTFRRLLAPQSESHCAPGKPPTARLGTSVDRLRYVGYRVGVLAPAQQLVV